MQHDLFRTRSAGLELKPAPGRSEPLLWVRRIIIWRDKGQMLREVPLRPGLNIIWSPDAAAEDMAIGHGSGKTTFCRLLRYCLGEDSYAPAGQRRATFDKMPNGRVGAEVRLDGRDWAIVRGFGPFGEWAVPDATLDLSFDEIPPTGIEPFRAAVADRLLQPVLRLLPRSIPQTSAWPAVLAWLTRDQECRFSHLLDWRDRDSDSNSPVRRASIEDRLTIVRAVLGALTPDELGAEAEREQQGQTADKLRATLARIEWQEQRTRHEMAERLGLKTGVLSSELATETFTSTAKEELATAVGLGNQKDPADLAKANTEMLRLERLASEAALKVERRETEIRENERTVRLLKDALPQLSAAAATVPLCTICHAPIDAIHVCDTAGQKAEYDRSLETYRAEQARSSQLQGSLGTLKQALALAKQQHEQQRTVVERLTRAAISRSNKIRQAEQLVADAERHERLLVERRRTADDLSKAENERERLKDLIQQQRATVASLLQQLSDRYDQIIGQLVPGDATGRAVLDGNGLHLHIDLGGDRSTAAFESLKIVMFDLAVLTLAVEGQSNFPGLLVHDSPREADLGESIYNELFRFADRLEGFGPAPLFQYLVTTTTDPPEEFRSSDRLVLTIKGAPAGDRLLRVDL